MTASSRLSFLCLANMVLRKAEAPHSLTGSNRVVTLGQPMQRGSRTVRLAYREPYYYVRGRKQTQERGGALLGAQPRPPDPHPPPRRLVVTHAPLPVPHRMRFRGPPANLLTLFSLPNTRAGQSPADPSEAADGATRSPPHRLLRSWQASLQEKSSARSTSTAKDMFPHYFFLSHFSISIQLVATTVHHDYTLEAGAGVKRQY